MPEEQRPDAVHWIDHVVVGTNDINAWVEWAVSALPRRYAAATAGRKGE